MKMRNTFFFIVFQFIFILNNKNVFNLVSYNLQLNFVLSQLPRQVFTNCHLIFYIISVLFQLTKTIFYSFHSH